MPPRASFNVPALQICRPGARSASRRRTSGIITSGGCDVRICKTSSGRELLRQRQVEKRLDGARSANGAAVLHDAHDAEDAVRMTGHREAGADRGAARPEARGHGSIHHGDRQPRIAVAHLVERPAAGPRDAQGGEISRRHDVVIHQRRRPAGRRQVAGNLQGVLVIGLAHGHRRGKAGRFDAGQLPHPARGAGDINPAPPPP